MTLSIRMALSFVLVNAFAPSVQAWTNDLRITSIVRTNDCTTLTWISHPGEFYAVYWTDNIGPGVNAFWRIADLLVPSGGTNTTWSDCLSGGGGGMAPQGSSFASGEDGPTEGMMLEEALTYYESQREAQAATIVLLKSQLEEAIKKAAAQRDALLNGATPKTDAQQGSPETMAPEPPGGGGGGGGTNDGPFTVTFKFYRVARVAVSGFVDGWGNGSGPIPSALTNAIKISAGPWDSGAHNLTLLSDGTVRAWGE